MPAVRGVAVERDAVGVAGDRECDPVLGPCRAGQRGLHGAQVEADVLGVDGLGGIRVVPQPLGLGIALDQREMLVVAPREAQVVDRHLVDREHGARGAVLGAHVADGRPRLQREGGDTGPVALDERTHNAVIAQQLGDGQHDIGRRDAGLGLPRNPQPHHRWQQHGQRLPEHGRLGLNAADAPTEHAQPVDHDGVRVRADQRVAEGAPVLGREHQARQVLEVDLVTDPHAGRHGPEVAEGTLGPADELVALHVAPVLNGDVGVVGRGVARALGDDGVVDDELDRDQRVDLGGVATQPRERVAHGGEVDHRRHAGEVLHEHPLGGEGDLVGGVAGPLAVTLGVGTPVGHGHDVVGRDVRPVLVTEEVFQEDLDGVGQARNVVAFAERRRRDVEDLVGAVADREVRPGIEGVGVLCVRRVGAHGPILP